MTGTKRRPINVQPHKKNNMSYIVTDDEIGPGGPASEEWPDDEFSAEPGLVFVYAPWCGHCKMAKSEMRASELRQRYRQMFRMHDATQGSEDVDRFITSLDIPSNIAQELNLVELRGELHVGGYPTMFIITRDSRVVPFEVTPISLRRNTREKFRRARVFCALSILS